MNNIQQFDQRWLANTDNRKFVETFQWSVIDSISSLLYSEYIGNIVEKKIPITRYMVPTIKSVIDILKPDSDFIRSVSNKLICGMSGNRWMTVSGFCNTGEYDKLKDEKDRTILQAILDSYIFTNVGRVIPNVIMKKFSIGIESNNGLMVEDYGIDLFKKGMLDDYYEYIIEEASMSLVTIIMNTDSTCVTGVDKIELTSDSILSINNGNAICRTLFSKDVATNPVVMDILKATVTNCISATDDTFIMETSKNNIANVITFI